MTDKRVDLHGMNVAVEVDIEPRHAALADGVVEVRVDSGELLLEKADVEIPGAVLAEDADNLLLDVAVGTALERYPLGVVVRCHLQTGQVLYKARKLRIAVIAGVEIRIDGRKALADLAEGCVLAIGIVVVRSIASRGVKEGTSAES